MADLNRNLVVFFQVRGVSSLTIELLKLSPTTVATLNRFAVESGINEAVNSNSQK
jgi:hypothetical protein